METMNESILTEDFPSTNESARPPDDDASSPLAVALASMIVGALDTASAVLDLVDKRFPRESNERAEPRRESNEAPANFANDTSSEEWDEDEIPVTTVNRSAAKISLDDWDEGDEDDDDDDANTVEVRVSPKMPRARPSRSAGERARSLAQAFVETAITELGDYIESSPAFEKLVRIRTERIIRELAADPEQLEPLIRAQSDAALAHLLEHPEKLEPLFQLFAEYQARNSPPERFPPTLPKK